MDFRHLAEYHLWAGEKTREKLYQLSDEEYKKEINIILGSPKAKAIHVVLAILFCFYSMNIDFDYLTDDWENTVNEINMLSRKDFLKYWKLVDKRFCDLIMENRAGSVTTPRQDGEMFCIQVNDFLLQYLFHTIYHRAQLNYCLKALNKPRIESDYLFYFADLDKRLETLK